MTKAWQLFYEALRSCIGYCSHLIAIFTCFYVLESVLIAYSLPFSHTPSLLWGLFGLVALFNFVPRLLQQASKKKSSYSHFLYYVVGYWLLRMMMVAGSSLVFVVPAMMHYGVEVVIKSSELRYAVWGLTVLVDALLGFTVIAWAYESIGIEKAFARGWLLLRLNWRMLFSALLALLPVYCLLQVQKLLSFAGHEVVTHLSTIQKVQVLFSYLLILVSWAVFIQVYRIAQRNQT